MDYIDVLERNIHLEKKESKLNKIVVSLFQEPYKIENTKNSTRFIIIGDLHGHITQSLKQVEKWINYSNLNIDAILQLGDLSVINNQSSLDKITLSLSKKDPEILGFKKYLYGSNEADYFFGINGIFKEIPFYFINGNHDDINILKNIRKNISVYPNFIYLEDGSTLYVNNTAIGVLGFNHKKSHIKNINDIDILLTHNYKKFNSIIPKYHFFSHHKNAVNLGKCKEFGLGHYNDKGNIGFLEISKNKDQFIYLPE